MWYIWWYHTSLGEVVDSDLRLMQLPHIHECAIFTFYGMVVPYQQLLGFLFPQRPVPTPTMTGAPPQDPDRCCSCTCCQYPNGPFQVILAQLLLFFGTFLSAAALGDCSFVTTTKLSFPPFLGIPERYEDPNETGTRRGVGFFFWELHDSEKCSWELFDTNIPDRILEEIWEYYFDNVLDSQWDIARALASIAWFLSFVTWCIILALT